MLSVSRAVGSERKPQRSLGVEHSRQREQHVPGPPRPMNMRDKEASMSRMVRTRAGATGDEAAEVRGRRSRRAS